jgi:hypothetical protein
MKRHTRFTSKEQSAAESQTHQTPSHEFSSVEDMLRHDANQVVVPPRVAHRIEESTRKLAVEKPAWWKRLFGGTKT